MVKRKVCRYLLIAIPRQTYREPFKRCSRYQFFTLPVHIDVSKTKGESWHRIAIVSANNRLISFFIEFYKFLRTQDFIFNIILGKT